MNNNKFFFIFCCVRFGIMFLVGVICMGIWREFGVVDVLMRSNIFKFVNFIFVYIYFYLFIDLYFIYYIVG